MLVQQSFINHVNTIIEEIDKGMWKDREQFLCNNINSLMSRLLMDQSQQVIGNHQVVESIHQLKEALTLLSKSVPNRINQLTIHALNIVGTGKPFGHKERLEIANHLPSKTVEDIHESLAIFKDLISKDSAGVEALAHWISYEQIPLSKLDFSKQELQSILTHLTFLRLDHTVGQHMREEDIQNMISQCEKLEFLELENDDIKKLSQLPGGLKRLTCRSNSLEEISNLNEGLKVFDCGSCENLKKLPDHLPDSLEEFYCYDCPSLEKISVLNNDLREFVCTNSPLITLPYTLNSGLKTFDCSQCPMQTLPVLPQGLKKITCLECNGLTIIDRLPDSLETLDARRCHNLERIDLPPRLQQLDVRDCPKLSLPTE